VHDVLVVGAGLSGLVAARELVAAGRDVVVVEARDRVGGRTLSKPLAGQTIDLGAQWLGDQHHLAHALAAELGVVTFEQHATGKKLLDRGDGHLRTYSGFLPRVSFGALAELGLALWRLERMAKRVPLDRPHAARRAAEWDAQSVGDWLDAHVRRPEARALITLAVEMILAAEPRDASFLGMLHYAHAGGGMRRLAEVRRGAQDRRMATGGQALSVGVASALPGRIRLDCPVRAIVQDTSSVTAVTATGPLTAHYAIAAVPPALLAGIELSPAAIPARRELHARMKMGSAIKCIAAYERPFWRDAGYSGEAIVVHGPIRATFDDCSADGAHAALVAFVVGDAARELSSMADEQRRARIVGELARLFGPAAASPIAYVDKDWLVDPWSTGCYVGVMPPGLLTTIGDAMRAPHGRIHFAGTETAVRHVGYLEGAIEAGQRAAAEVRERFATS
jgi:monoamine oxidase